MNSIKTFLLSWILGIIALAVLAIGIVSYKDAQHEIEELFDAELAKTAKMVMHLMPSESIDKISTGKTNNLIADLDAAAGDLKTSHKYEHKIAYQIFDRRLKLITESPNAPDFQPQTSETGFLTKTIKGETWYLFIIYNVHKQQWLVTAQHGDIREELVTDILRHLLVPFIVGTPILILLVWFFLGKGLKPLLLLANSIARREPQNLQALQMSATPELKTIPIEIKPIVESLNQLFERLADTMAREKRFTADASHELRTPLSILKIHAQNAAAAENFSECKESLSQLLLGVDKSTHLVEQLLKLARLEPRQTTRNSFELVNFSLLLKEEFAQQFPRSLKNQQQLEIHLPEQEFCLKGDSLVLSLMIRNLLDNAIRYCPQGGSIDINLAEKNGKTCLAVINSSDEITAEQQERLFERFYRVNQGITSGSGLGLSIVQQCAEIHQASIKTPITESQFVLEICFPHLKQNETI